MSTTISQNQNIFDILKTSQDDDNKTKLKQNNHNTASFTNIKSTPSSFHEIFSDEHTSQNNSLVTSLNHTTSTDRMSPHSLSKRIQQHNDDSLNVPKESTFQYSSMPEWLLPANGEKKEQIIPQALLSYGKLNGEFEPFILPEEDMTLLFLPPSPPSSPLSLDISLPLDPCDYQNLCVPILSNTTSSNTLIHLNNTSTLQPSLLEETYVMPFQETDLNQTNALLNNIEVEIGSFTISNQNKYPWISSTEHNQYTTVDTSSFAEMEERLNMTLKELQENENKIIMSGELSAKDSLSIRDALLLTPHIQNISRTKIPSSSWMQSIPVVTLVNEFITNQEIGISSLVKPWHSTSSLAEESSELLADPFTSTQDISSSQKGFFKDTSSSSQEKNQNSASFQNFMPTSEGPYGTTLSPIYQAAIQNLMHLFHSRLKKEFNLKNTSFSLQVKSEALGEIHITLNIQNGQASTAFKGSTEAMQIINQHREDIINILKDFELTSSAQDISLHAIL